MRWSEIYLKTLKDKPAGASVPSHILLLRSGLIYGTSQGIFTYNTLFLKAIQKLEKIIREELENEGAREILMPMVQPKKLWEETSRWNQFEGLLQKLKSRSDQEFCLGPTHEEVVTDFVRSSLISYKDMPFNLYQIQTKYRDEIRPRFGLMRAKEFIMKDAYSFDVSKEESQKNYQKMFKAYKRIFTRLGVRFVVVQADTGSIGGDQSEEFHILADKGEDVLLVSDEGAFAANREICPTLVPPLSSHEKEKALEEFATPDIVTISDLAQFLKCEKKDLVKILFFVTSKGDSKDSQIIAVLCQGSDEVNPNKLKRFLSLSELPYLADANQIQKISGSVPGSCGPYRLKQSIPIYSDHKLKDKTNFIVGANKEGFHFKNVNPKRDFKIEKYGDFCYAKQGDLSPDGKGKLKEHRGIEVGHLFYLSDVYSRKMQLTFLDSNGKKQYIQMGCYGLGVTRALQALVEQSHDEDGIVWPLSVAPFSVHICLIDKTPEVLTALEEVLKILKEEQLDYFIDDRKERPGIKFKDADLLGLPIRLSLGERDLKNSEIEFYVRKTKQKQKIKISDLKMHLSLK
ncbi:MAG: proline--tRNA ligase [Bdellovibrionales bacterium]